MDENIFPTVPLPTLDADVENIQKLDDEPNDVGGLTAAQLKEEFDKGNVTIKKWINENFIPALQSAEGASGIGAKDLNENSSDVQAELDKLKNLGGASSTAEQVDQAVQDSHTHENKALLDTYTQTEEELSSAVIQKHSHDNKGVLDGIKEVTQSLGNSSDKVPSEKAVSEALVLAGGIPGGGYTQQVLKKRSDASFDLEWANDAVMVVDFGECALDTPFPITEAQSSLLLNTNAPVARATINGQSVDARRFSLSGTTALYSGILYDGEKQYFTSIKIDGLQATVTSGTAFDINDIVNEEQFTANLGDTTTPAKKLGLTGDLSVGASLGVLATAGDLHVWRRTVKYSEKVPASYKLEKVRLGTFRINGVNESNPQTTIKYSSSLVVSDSGVVGLENPDSFIHNNSNGNDEREKFNVIKGKFFSAENSIGSDIIDGKIYFVPSDSLLSMADNIYTGHYYYITKIQDVTGIPAVPPGIYVDYPVSVNPNAYQTGSDAQPAGYTLGEPLSEIIYQQSYVDSGIDIYTSDDVVVNDDGTIQNQQFADKHTFNMNSSSVATIKQQIQGKFFAIQSSVYYAPETFTVTFYPYVPAPMQEPKVAFTGLQLVTGYPAIPAGTTIEALGKLGDKARIVTGSYVGTGTYGVNNANTLTFEFVPKFVLVSSSGTTGGQIMGIFSPWSYPDTYVNNGYRYVSASGVQGGYAKMSGNTLSWYASSYSVQLNTKDTYNYITIG